MLSTVRPLKVIAAATMLAVGVCILAFGMSNDNAANRDLICYWAAGKQLLHHGNPYGGAEILQVEREAGFRDSRPFFMRNPPIAFFLAASLGWMSIRVAAIVWSLLLVGALLISIRMIWVMEGRSKDRLHLVGYVFPPALACLLAGQLGILILLGVTSFLYLRHSRPFIAGAVLLLCLLKPQLFLPFGCVLVAWCVQQGAYRILAGAAASLGASLLFAYALDPLGWPQYARMASEARLEGELIPTVSLLFRLAIDRSAAWLQFVPAMAASVWALWYFRRSAWDWREQGLLLLVISVIVAPYAWFTDETVLLPAILHGLYVATERRRTLIPFYCLSGAALVEVLSGVPFNSIYYLWTAPAWLVFYLQAGYVRERARVPQAEPGISS